MYITWLGQSCFKLQTKDVTLLTDPYDPTIGLKLPRVTADIVTVSHDHRDHNHSAGVSGTPFVIDHPGEYEIKGVTVHGFPSWHDDQEGAERGTNTIFRVTMEELTIAHLGDLGTALSEAQQEELEGVDILFVPVGGVYTIDGKTAAKLTNDLEPRIVIPMHYHIPGLKLKTKLDGSETFLRELGAKQNEPEEKFRITKKELPVGEMRIVTLKP